MKNLVVVVGFVALLTGQAAAGGEVTLDNPGLYDLQVVGIELANAAELQIEAVGVWDSHDDPWISRWWREQNSRPMTVYAWLLDSRTRRTVWVMELDETEGASGTLRRAEQAVSVDRGRYELYLFSGYGWAIDRERRVLDEDRDEKWWQRIFADRRTLDDIREDLEECRVTVSAPGLSRFDVTAEIAGSLIRLDGIGDSHRVSRGFKLDRTANLRVYSLFEMGTDAREAADYGWIVNAETREVVWHPRDSRSRRAGGATKNRLIDTEIELPAGRYVLYYGSDDSHSFAQFNAAAPYDPLNWGITVLPGEGFDATAFSTFDPADQPAALIEFARTGDDAFHEQAFELKQDSSLQLYAVGEYDYDDDQFYDHGWIADAETGENVWEMTGRNTEGAGGADKNRMFDGIADLPRGRYVLYYVSDGSHSFDNWNVAPPFDAQAWGIRVSPGPGFDGQGFALLDRDDLGRSSGYLVRIAHVGDDARVERRFTLDTPSTVEIRAIGEGSSGSMHDYGLLREAASGRVVWEMEYDDTRHAGGADKNRWVVRELRLEPGEYEAVYVSDGSHSFRGWNAERPRDPIGWGLTIRHVDR